MFFLKDYDSSGDDECDGNAVDVVPVSAAKVTLKDPITIHVDSAPHVDKSMLDIDDRNRIDPSATEIFHNPSYDELFGETGVLNNDSLKSHKNTYTGYIEPTFIQSGLFENERLKYDHFGVAYDPAIGSNSLLGDSEMNDEAEKLKRKNNKRKRLKNDDPTDIDGYLGPWAAYENQERVSRPSPELMKELEEYKLKKQRKTGKPCADSEDVVDKESTTLHIETVVDYQGRSFLHAPHDIGVKLKNPPTKCFLPKSLVHTWNGHTKGVAVIRWFPKTAHLLLSGGMDSKVKLWQVYNEKRLIRTYSGHKQAVRDADFNYSGQKFLSASYDRYIKEWDTETGKCLGRFNCRKVPYCVRYHPDANKSNLFVAGTSSKKILCWDTRSGEIVQEYDRHLGAVNSITFVDDNRRFVTTSDDKSLRVWEWDIPVDMKYIADPTMHSIPSVTLSPNAKWLACQSMDNKVSIFSALNRYKLNRKKQFTGHMVAGYACSVDFSPDMSYLVSGDADGKCYIWDWKSSKLFKKWKAHDAVCINSLWHPHEPSRVVTASWDGMIKMWN